MFYQLRCRLALIVACVVGLAATARAQDASLTISSDASTGIEGTGSIVLTSGNSFSGGTTVSDGTLLLNNGGDVLGSSGTLAATTILTSGTITTSGGTLSTNTGSLNFLTFVLNIVPSVPASPFEMFPVSINGATLTDLTGGDTFTGILFLNSGNLEAVTSADSSFITVVPQAVPEPTALYMALLAGVCFLALRRRAAQGDR